jgi:hypothetical protein
MTATASGADHANRELERFDLRARASDRGRRCRGAASAAKELVASAVNSRRCVHAAVAAMPVEALHDRQSETANFCLSNLGTRLGPGSSRAIQCMSSCAMTTARREDTGWSTRACSGRMCICSSRPTTRIVVKRGCTTALASTDGGLHNPLRSKSDQLSIRNRLPILVEDCSYDVNARPPWAPASG